MKLCENCKQKELCDLTEEYKELRFKQTGKCSLYIPQKNEELKTLKDLRQRIYPDKTFCEDSEGNWVSYDDLHQEAIKWIKEKQEIIQEGEKIIRKESTLTNAGIREVVRADYAEDFAVIIWIKHFFNIKEEGLT